MKRRLLVSAIILLIVVCAVLNREVIDPAEYTGAWYGAEDAALYVFGDGLISCAALGEEEAFSGAYSFAKGRAAMFVIDANGVSEVVELHLIRRHDGDYLCETEDGSGKIWFYRNQQAAGDR